MKINNKNFKNNLEKHQKIKLKDKTRTYNKWYKSEN